MKIKKLLSFIVLLFTCMHLCAQTPKLPTPNSEPLPNISETQNSDVRLTEEVQKKISHSSQLKNQPISAAAAKGIVTLQGSVKTQAQEKIANDLAKSVTGVKKVKSQLTVRAN